MGHRAELRLDRPLPQAGSRPRGYPVLGARLLRPRRSHDPRQTDRPSLMKRGLRLAVGDSAHDAYQTVVTLSPLERAFRNGMPPSARRLHS